MTRTTADLRRECLARRGGFIVEADLPEIIAADRLTPLLIRHSHGRMICAAQDVSHHCQLVANWPGAYVRDISWPAYRTPADATGAAITYRASMHDDRKEVST